MEKKKSSTKITIMLLLLFCVLTFAGGSFFPIEEENLMSIDFSYNGKVWKWSDQEVYEDISIFTHSAQAQKNGRQGNYTQRAELIERIHKLGFSYEDSFDYTFPKLREKVDKMCLNINTEMENATLSFNPKKSPYFHYTDEKTGYYVEKEELYQSLLQQIQQKARVRIEVQPRVIKPEITKKSLVQQTQLKSNFETGYACSSDNRKTNIKIAMSSFNGLILEPNKEYSFNKITGKRTEEKGYKEANIIVNDEYTEAFGGGVCQVSTTLYNALLLAGLNIIEVHPHSLASSYVMAGFDAMVNYGSSDLKWINKTETPIYIRTYATGEVTGVEVYGNEDVGGIEIKRSSQEIKKIEPPEDKIIFDENMFEDESEYKTAPKQGCQVYSYLEYWKDGKMLSKNRIRVQTYHAVQGVKIIGTKIRPVVEFVKPEPSDTINKQLNDFINQKATNDPFDMLFPLQ